MSFSYSKKYTSSSISPSHTMEDSKKKSLLKDNSWIRRDEEEDEDVDRDPNFGKSILGRYSKSIETIDRVVPEEKSDTKVTSYVQAVSKRFSTSQDELNQTSTSPTSYGQRTTFLKSSSSSSLRSPRSPTYTSTLTESPKTSTTTTTITEKGGTTETTTTTISGSETFTERVFSDGKSSIKRAPFSSLSPSSTKVTETIITSSKGTEDPFLDAPTSDSKTVTVQSGTDGNTYSTTTKTRTSSSTEDKLYDTLLPRSMSGLSSPTRAPFSSLSPSSTKVTETIITSSKGTEDPFLDAPDSKAVTVQSGTDGNTYSRTTKTRTSSSTEDKLYDTLLPRSLSGLSSPTRIDDYVDGDSYTSKSSIKTVYSTPERNTYSKTTTTRTSSSTEDKLYDSRYPSITPERSSSVRTVLEKDLCTYCRKPFNAEAKMVLDDMKIKCHASCFKCDVCSNTLENLKAGDSLWIYRRMVHCDRCFEVTREKWHR